MDRSHPTEMSDCCSTLWTERLRHFLDSKKRDLSQEHFETLLEALEDRFSQYQRRLLEVESGETRALLALHLMNEALMTVSHVKVSCASGCAGCCHLEVEITEDEAKLLACAVQQGVAFDADRLALQAGRPTNAPEWKTGAVSENRCVFLSEQNLCRVYEHRPLACRKLLVTSPKENCTLAQQSVQPIPVLEAELLLSAVLSLPKTKKGHLASMLQTALHSGDTASE